MAAESAGSPAPAKPAGPLLLLDGMSLAFRAYFALPPDLATSAGIVTNAVHGFTSMLHNLVRDHHPSGLAVAFDLPGGTFRDEVVADYKGGRSATPADLLPQFEMIRSLLGKLAIPVIEAEGFEADDVLATLASEARDRGHDVLLVTGDRDAYQLVEDPHIRVLYNRRGVSDYALYDEAGIEERTGVRPELYPILASLRGDQSDNLPGVPGVGEKTAAKLVNEYGDLDTLYAHLDALSPKLRENLALHEERVRMNAEVIPLVRDVPLDTHIDQLTLGGWIEDDARDAFAELELRTIWNRMVSLIREGAFGQPGGDGPRIPMGGNGAKVDEGPGGPGTTESPAAAAWLDSLQVITPNAGEAAVAAVEQLVTEARAATGNVALHAAWSGDPGRSPLVSLTLTAEPTEPAEPADGPAEPGKPGDRSGEVKPGGQRVLYLGDAAAGPSLVAQRSVLDSLAGALGPGGVGVIAHNAKEIMRSLLPLGVDVTGLTMDTAVSAYLLDPSVDHYRLRDLSVDHLGIEVDDGEQGKGQGTFTLEIEGEDEAGGAGAERVPAHVLAAARLAATVSRLRAPLQIALVAEEEDQLYGDIERPLVRVLARMEVTGIPVDREVLRAIARELAEECQTLEARIHELAGEPFNVNSVPQLRSVLYDRLGLTPLRKTKTGYSTDARTLEQLRDQHPIVETLLRYREIEKLRSTYGESLIAEVSEDGRIHATFRQTVARTGRLSSDRPNLHNIPVRTDQGRRFRQAFVPSPGRRLLVADYDQVELRAIAHLSGDPGLSAAFEAGEDIHRTVAARVFGVERDEVTHAQRSTAKMVSYGLAYGMEAYGLSQRLGVPVEEASTILRSFFDGFPAVQDYMQRAVADARNSGYTITAFGRRRPLPDLLATNYQVRQGAERQAMNAGIQGLAADLFKLALVRLDTGLHDGGFRSDLVLQVHDEVIIDVVPEESDDIAELTQRALTGAADLSVPLKVAMAWGSSWAEAKDG
ncbi:MAG TPA: DNA polymerase I [Acidimicrobiales bacterium]|nr:DNA polymerase I [Acidimicrobiales bacterium]